VLSFLTQTPNGTIYGNGGIVFDLPMGSYPITYQAADGCQNTGSCQVLLSVVDNVSPVAVCGETTVVSLNNLGIASVPAATFDDGSYDACCAEVTFLGKRMDQPAAPFAPNVVFNCNDVGDTVMVIFQAVDCYGNTNTCMIAVLVQDKLPPIITCPADITIACNDPLPPSLSQTGSPVVMENCGVDTLFYQDIENLNQCHTGTISRTFTVWDNAGFQATCTQTITTVDLTPPQFFFPADTTVDCSVPLDQIGTNGAIALGDCELFALNISDENYPIPCGQKIIRTYSFIEWCSGFDTSGVQEIIAIDTNPPVWDQPLGSLDKVFVCGSDIVKPPPPTATDFCSPWEVLLVSDTTFNVNCEHQLTRVITYTAFDTCGNVAEPFVITIMVNDTIAPTANLPDLGPFNCYADRPAPDTINLDASDNCINPIVINFVGDTGNPGCMGTVVRTYRLTDVCGNDTLVTQNILINDTLPPTADPDTLKIYGCLADIPSPNQTTAIGQADACGGPVSIQHLSDLGAPVCEGLVLRTYRLRDECLNESLAVLPILLNDTIPPSLNCPPAPIMANNSTNTCYAIVGILVSAVDNCAGAPVTISNDYNSGGAMVNDTFPIGISLINFTAQDACGNQSSCTVTINVKDVVKPSIGPCFNIDWDLDPFGFAYIDVDSIVQEGLVFGMDLCSEVTYSIDPDTLDCLDYVAEPTFIPYVLTVTDAAGNTSTCSVDIVLHDPLDACNDDGLIVNGRIFTKNQQAMPGVELRLYDNQNMSTVLTATNGLFSFENLVLGMSCTLQPYKNDDLLNGVTTYDLVLVTRHILGTQIFNSPYQYIAADINNSGTITTFDVVNLRKAILLISDEFPGNTSWRFIRSGYQFPNPADPFEQTLPESAWLQNLSYDAVAMNFIGVKIGDINGNAVAGFNGGLNDREGEGELPFFAEEAQLKKGETARVPVFADAHQNIAALQMTIQFDPALLALEGMEGAAISAKEHNSGQPRPGYLTFSWETVEGQVLEPGMPLFYLQFQVLENTTISQVLAINSTMTPAIAYKMGGDPLNILWRIHEAPQRPVDAAHLFSLAQNRPNPFSSQSTIGFVLKQNMPVKLEVSDVTGRRWLLLDEELAAGYHEVPVNGGDFANPGLYFYQLTTPFGKEQRKMLKL
jgi:hypothetical protein